MGGNALTYESVRLTKSNYNHLATDCVARLQALYPHNRFEPLRAYREKADFGDLDLLCESTGFDPFKAASAVDAVEVVRNGPVTSVGVLVRPEVPYRDGNVFQVDFVTMPPESFDFASCYFAWNDCGNLLGRVAHAMGVALRHDGLYWYVREGTYKFAELLLTRDFSQALTFLGYDPERYAKGFDTLEEMFEFVATTPYFDTAIYLLENRNNTSRTRDRKRKAYCEFLKWCEVTPGLTAYAFPEEKTAWLPRLAAHFPQFQSELDDALAELARQREAKTRFCGALVTEWTGLEGKALGALMKQFKESFASLAEQQAFVLENDTQTLKARVQQTLATMDWSAPPRGRTAPMDALAHHATSSERYAYEAACQAVGEAVRSTKDSAEK